MVGACAEDHGHPPPSQETNSTPQSNRVQLRRNTCHMRGGKLSPGCAWWSPLTATIHIWRSTAIAAKSALRRQLGRRDRTCDFGNADVAAYRFTGHGCAMSGRRGRSGNRTFPLSITRDFFEWRREAWGFAAASKPGRPPLALLDEVKLNTIAHQLDATHGGPQTDLAEKRQPETIRTLVPMPHYAEDNRIVGW